MEGSRIATGGFAIDCRSAGKAEAENLGHFVERFACRIIAGAAKEIEMQRFTAMEEHRVSAADDEAHARKNVSFGGDASSVNMALDMIDCNQRDLECDGQHFGGTHTNQQGADQARRIVNRDATNLGKKNAGLAQGLVNHRQRSLQMGASRYFRHDAAVALV